MFAKFRELGSARQVFLWLRSADLKMPVVLRNIDVYKLIWKAPAYHSVMQILHNPLYAGAYAFGRKSQRTRIVDGRARKVSGFDKPREEWNVLLRDNHAGYISWQDYEDNQRLLLENAHMKKNCARKSARGGRALLTGLMRCGRCGRMMRVFYGQSKGHAHRYQCRGDDAHVGARDCASASAASASIVRSPCRSWMQFPTERWKLRWSRPTRSTDRTRRSSRRLERQLEAARYEASLAARRYELVDPAKRHVAPRVRRPLERCVGKYKPTRAEAVTICAPRRRRRPDHRSCPAIQGLLTICRRLGTLRPPIQATKQRLIHILVKEIVLRS